VVSVLVLPALLEGPQAVANPATEQTASAAMRRLVIMAILSG
jgi:hypothetical protein